MSLTQKRMLLFGLVTLMIASGVMAMTQTTTAASMEPDDTTPPSVSIEAPVAPLYEGNQYFWIVEMEDAESGIGEYAITVDGIATALNFDSTVEIPNTVGTHTIEVSATSEGGTTTATSTVEILPVASDIDDLIDALIEKITDSPEECWGQKNHKATMINKVTELKEMNLEDAYDKLLHDIKPKLTGLKEDENGNQFGNGIFKNPWVTCETLQEEFEQDCNELLSAFMEDNNGGMVIM